MIYFIQPTTLLGNAHSKRVTLPAPSDRLLCSVAIMLDHIGGDVGPRTAQPRLAMHRYGTLLSLAELQKRLRRKKKSLINKHILKIKTISPAVSHRLGFRRLRRRGPHVWTGTPFAERMRPWVFDNIVDNQIMGPDSVTDEYISVVALGVESNHATNSQAFEQGHVLLGRQSKLPRSDLSSPFVYGRCALVRR